MAESNNPVTTSSPQEPSTIDEDDGYEEVPATMWDYLQTDKGHQIADKVVTILADIKNTATETISSERASRLSAEISLRKFQHWVQLSVFILAGGLAAVLSFFGKLEPSVAMLLGTMVGYFFGRSKT